MNRDGWDLYLRVAAEDQRRVPPIPTCMWHTLIIALNELFFRRWTGRCYEYEPRHILRYPSGEYEACRAGRQS
jgi:hypothetical protein